jgi:hypothetical protein
MAGRSDSGKRNFLPYSAHLARSACRVFGGAIGFSRESSTKETSMKRLVCALGAAALVGFGVQAALGAEQPIHAGVGPSSGPMIGSADVSTGSPDGLVNFDGVTAPLPLRPDGGAP